MTPEEARELLERATPAPWQVHIRDRHFLGETETWLYVGDTPALSWLMSAAPVLAEQIASMHYEYAVQGPDGRWVRETDDRNLALTIDPMSALRHCHPRIIERLAEAASAQFGCEFRIVRRLVSEPEVVE